MGSDSEEGTMEAEGPRLDNGEESTGGSVWKKGRNAFGVDVFPVPGLGPGLRGVVGSLDGGLVGRTERASVGDKVMASAGLALLCGMLGRVGRAALGDVVFPGPGLGPGLRGGVDSIDGGLDG